MNTSDDQHQGLGTAIPEQDMRVLLDNGNAEPLLPDTFPVPARYDGWWWHQPTRFAEGDTADVPFVAASSDQVARYDELLQRRRQAHAEPVGQPPDE